MKAFVGHTQVVSHRLADALSALADQGCDARVALLHYAPVPDTLVGERLEIYPFLGSQLLGEAIDRAGADLALHGHAHAGTEHGETPGGVPVRNVAMPVIGCAYRVFTFGAPSRGPREVAEPAAGATMGRGRSASLSVPRRQPPLPDRRRGHA